MTQVHKFTKLNLDTELRKREKYNFEELMENFFKLMNTEAFRKSCGKFEKTQRYQACNTEKRWNHQVSKPSFIQ